MPEIEIQYITVNIGRGAMGRRTPLHYQRPLAIGLTAFVKTATITLPYQPKPRTDDTTRLRLSGTLQAACGLCDPSPFYAQGYERDRVLMVTERSPRAEGTADIPEVVIMRLPQYVRVLTRLSQQGIEVVSSQQLGRQIQTTPAQIRKDLSYFGRFGKQGRGYTVNFLLGELRHILGLDREWKVALVGVGRLGRAVLSYPGFAPQGFKLVAAFDADPRQVRQVVGGVSVQPMHRMQEVIQEAGIRIAIVAVPASHAQEVIDRLADCNIRAIVNYASIAAQVPPRVRLRNIDPVLALQSLTFYLRSSEEASQESAAP